MKPKRIIEKQFKEFESISIIDFFNDKTNKKKPLTKIESLKLKRKLEYKDTYTMIQ